MNNNEFKYGWCHTVSKTGKLIEETQRLVDYFQDEARKDFVYQALKAYGLPKPNLDKDVFRGTSHDILFLDSHGLVVRIGYTNIDDLVNPAIIQPLHWMNDPNSKTTVAIYPGVELLRNYTHDEKLLELSGIGFQGLQSVIRHFGNCDYDCILNNVGVLPVMVENKKHWLALLLDADSSYNASNLDKEARIVSKGLVKSSGDIAPAMSEVYNNSAYLLDVDPRISLYTQIFEYHQPIRRAFRMAFNGKNDGTSANQVKLRRAWKMVENYHTQGYQIWKKPEFKPGKVKKIIYDFMTQQLGNKHKLVKKTFPETVRQKVETRHLFNPWEG